MVVDVDCYAAQLGDFLAESGEGVVVLPVAEGVSWDGERRLWEVYRSRS